MSRPDCFALCCWVACSIAVNGHAAWPEDAPQKQETLTQQPTSHSIYDLAWLDPANHMRPHKGFRTHADNERVPALLWVLYRENGQPLAVDQFASSKVDGYFHSRLEAKLTRVCKQYPLSTSLIAKLYLAGELDIARLNRLALQVDEELRVPDIEQDRRSLNRLMHSLAIACDQELFEKSSLFQRVLATQLSLEPVASK